MPLITTFAAGSTRGLGQFRVTVAGAPVIPASIVATSVWNTTSYTTAGTAVPVQLPAGTQAGDAVIIINGFSGFQAAGSTTNKTGWSATTYLNDTFQGYYGTIFTKTSLTSGDLTGMTITPSDSSGSSYGTYLAVTFRGIASFVTQLNSTIASGVASFNATGVTKATNSRFILSLVNDRSAGNFTVGSGWTQLAQGKDTTSGVFTIAGSYKEAASYTNSETIPWSRSSTAYSVGNWTIDARSVGNAPPSVEYLVVAGGGGGGGGSNAGGYTGGGGGGAGGFRTGTLNIDEGTSYTVTVGAGGAAGSAGTFGSNGSSSVFSSITSNGGGRGSNGAGIAYDASGGGGGGAGGSGGGSGYRFTVGGAGTPGQGNNGGYAGTGEEGSGGGGGAGAVGGNGSTSPAQYTGGNGGNGTASSITGSSVTYAGGGGAGGLGDGGYNGRGGTGGTGGGGTGGGNNGTYTSPGGNATAGTTNLGGGGGGGTRNVGGNTPALGAAGGSGVVIIRYADTFPAATTTTGSPEVTTAGGFRIYRWTSSGSITF